MAQTTGISLRQAGSEKNVQFGKISKSRRWSGTLLRERASVLGWCVLLMASSTAIGILAIDLSLPNRVEEHVDKSLRHEVEKFQEWVKTDSPQSDRLVAMAGEFLERENPQKDSFLFALFNGQLYKSKSLALPESLRAKSPLLGYWSQLLRPEQGKISIPGGTLLYRAEPIEIGGQVKGVLVAANIIALEGDRFSGVTMPIARLAAIAPYIAAALAWIVVCFVLVRTRSLLKAARKIAESDLNQRIPVRGTGEVAELGRTFNKILDRAEAALGEGQNFINYVGHELRTPITIVRGHLELLGTDPAEQEETVALVLDELDRMSRLVNDLVLLAKAERPDFLDLETVEVASLTEELYAKARTLGSRSWRLEGKGSGKIALDRGRLTQAIMNLVENATHYTTDNDAIALGSATTEEAVYFWVSDRGEGIPETEQEKIFEGGVRGASAKLHCEGSGLGLSIVKAIAVAHGGRVELKSQPGRGSVFTLVIPRVAIEFEPEIELEVERFAPTAVEPQIVLACQHSSFSIPLANTSESSSWRSSAIPLAKTPVKYRTTPGAF
ncbi:MAG: HAMP domain-containing histidine kinase [Oscillatoria sp. SIO1A7]|nr:HAMP domain-containing histidine kinase [Oscillatoria sp. SIO1A7]